jgi:multimeric flavodoxin WrbA/putative sterol carrier protein
MSRIVDVLPTIISMAYITISTICGLRLPVMRYLSLAAMLLTGLAIYFLRRKDRLSPIHKGFLLFMIFSVVTFWTFPVNFALLLSAYPVTFLYGSLFAVAFLPALFLKRYFTEYFARKSTPSAVWETSIFRKINRDMTWMWACIFLACLVITLIPVIVSLHKNILTGLAFQMVLPGLVMLAIGVPFNKRYPPYCQRKMGIEQGPPAKSGQAGRPGQPAIQIQNSGKEEKIMANQLTVVALNGSPHAGIGNTSLMIRMMEPALRREGIDLEEIFLTEKRIDYCIGCGVCMEKGKCWRSDDHAAIVDKVLEADGIILASPVYFKGVTAQMKTFIDRSLSLGHKPRTTWKPGLAVSVSAGMAECSTANYLAGVLRVYGAFSVGTLTAISVSPGGFLGKAVVEARAEDLAGDLARALKEKRRYPATEEDLFYYLFMGNLVDREKGFMADDYRHWQQAGLYDGFEKYAQQYFTAPQFDPALRKAWRSDMISRETSRLKGHPEEGAAVRPARGPQSAGTCRELLMMMPLAFRKDVAADLDAVYQFEITGEESFTAHLKISGGHCEYSDGPHDAPDVTIRTPAGVWLAISRGKADGQSAFMTGKYKVEGDLSLLLKLKNLFS